MSNKETLALMLAAEQREGTWAEEVAMTKLSSEQFFGIDCSSIVKAVTHSIAFDEQCRGEIDAVEQSHYLRGPNCFTEQDLRAMEWEAKTEVANR